MRTDFPIYKLLEAQKECRLTPRKNRLIAVHVARLTPVMDSLELFDPSRDPASVRLGTLLSEEEAECVACAHLFANGRADRECLSWMHARQAALTYRYGSSWQRAILPDRLEHMNMVLRHAASGMAEVVVGHQAPAAAHAALLRAAGYCRLTWDYARSLHLGDPLVGRWTRFHSLFHQARVSADLLANDLVTDIALPGFALAGRHRFHPTVVEMAEGAAAVDHAPDEVAVLADAIEEYLEAGTLRDAAMRACRSGGVHHEGFWVTDLIRGMA